MREWSLNELLDAYARAAARHGRAEYAERLALVAKEQREATERMRQIEAEIERRINEGEAA